MSTLLTQSTVHEEVQQGAQEVIALRRYLHQHPEPSLKEYETIKFIKNQLDQLEIPYESVGETGAIGTIIGQKGPGKTILLRADIDALELEDAKDKPYKSLNEGLHHACGHDGHTSALLGAAKILKNHEADFAGTIKLAFQQAEEIGAGARQFVSGGFVHNVDQFFGIHVDSSIETGKIVSTAGPTNASCDIFKIKVTGESGHAARPDLGRDALLTAAAITVELQSIVAREVSPLDNVVVAVGVLNAGTRYNIIANEASLEGTVRTFSHTTRQFVLEAVERVARDVATAHRTTIEFENYDAAAPLINHQTAASRAARVGADIVGAENVIQNNPKSLGADDFADFLAVAEGVYARVGTKDPTNPDTWYGHHHENFDIDERGLAIATELHVNYALDFLNDLY
ncbi:putative amidohydrolase YhaA [Carnobacterium sp. 17-4]|uniref:amidohydrolase n=1 Tax=Carnobacterium sp. (strain 17-4) TaxID=208596 RepID=UPI0002058CBE|nr:amidohydrolase [Carnobacterium sp. 17-4]AEB29004.1 putative amidohydrolase YhaA [Carnobacterium sp. 17-4]